MTVKSSRLKFVIEVANPRPLMPMSALNVNSRHSGRWKNDAMNYEIMGTVVTHIAPRKRCNRSNALRKNSPGIKYQM